MKCIFSRQQLKNHVLFSIHVVSYHLSWARFPVWASFKDKKLQVMHLLKKEPWQASNLCDPFFWSVVQYTLVLNYCQIRNPPVIIIIVHCNNNNSNNNIFSFWSLTKLVIPSPSFLSYETCAGSPISIRHHHQPSVRHHHLPSPRRWWRCNRNSSHCYSETKITLLPF